MTTTTTDRLRALGETYRDLPDDEVPGQALADSRCDEATLARICARWQKATKRATRLEDQQDVILVFNRVYEVQKELRRAEQEVTGLLMTLAEEQGKRE